MNEILISFCIPVFNSELTIKKAVDNLLKLKSNNFEIVLYYDESSDRTIEIIQSFNSPYVRIVKNTSRKKYGRMMIDCIMAGSGKYVMYTILSTDKICRRIRMNLRCQVLINVLDGF